MSIISAKEVHDGLIMKRVYDHLEESFQRFDQTQVVGVFLQGSQNYGLEVPGSDVDTKLIVTPSFRDIALNLKPVSTTHHRENDEHIDWKDVRLYMETFRKQNLNFLEILFTPYKWVNPMYERQWQRLIEAREQIARMNPYRAVHSMRGIALEKYHAMEHRYPSKVEIIDKYGYDNKQLHHLLRVEDYLARYIQGESYESCLRPSDPEALRWEKTHFRPLEEAREIALAAKESVETMAKDWFSRTEDGEDPEMRALLQDVQCEIMKISVYTELERERFEV